MIKAQPETSLITFSVLLLLAAVAETFWPKQSITDITDEINTPVSPREISLPVSATIDELTTYSVIIRNPLFTVDRTPYEPPVIEQAPVVQAVAAKPEPEPEPEQAEEVKLVVQGIIRTPQAQIALIQAEGDNRTQRVQVSDEVEGWTVIAIASNTITLEKNGQERTLYLLATPDDTAQ